jgi:hypothetical protein
VEIIVILERPGDSTINGVFFGHKKFAANPGRFSQNDSQAERAVFSGSGRAEDETE